MPVPHWGHAVHEGRSSERRKPSMTPSEVLEFAKNKGAKILDLRFMDFPGLWRSVSDRGRGLIRGRAWL